MKSRVLFLLALVAGSANMSAQNLVPNGSFEEGSECPMFLDDLHFRCYDWYKSIQVPSVPMNENPSPDWYHECSELEALSTPDFVFGYQNPIDGMGLAAISCFNKDNPEYREIMGVELVQPLEVGVTYTVSFNVVGELRSVSTGIAANKIGFKLTTSAFFYSFESAVNNFAHGFLEDIVTDTLSWTSVSFEFTSDSAYTNLHIGSFFTNDQMDTLTLGTNFPRSAYYLFDDIALVPSSISNSAENIIGLNFQIFPNPAKESITVQSSDFMKLSGRDYKIFSLNGSTTISGQLHSATLNIHELPKGFYIIRIELTQGEFIYQKFSKM